MASISRFGDIGSRVAAHAIVQLLLRAIPLMPLEKFAQAVVVPMGSTTTVKWRRFEPLPINTAPLVEGITPEGFTPTTTDVTATLSQYGAYIGHSDVIMDVATDPVLMQFKDSLAENCAQTLEIVRYNALLAGTNAMYANGTARSAVNTALSTTLLRKAARALVRNNARPITRITSSSPNYGSQAVEAAFVAFVHPDLESDLRGLSGFVHVKNYGPASTPMDGEIGSWERIRFIESTLFVAFAGAGGTKGSMIGSGTAADVYPIVLIGQDAWASVALRMSSTGGERSPDGTKVVNPVQLIVKNPDSGGAENPLNQRGSVGWKSMFAAQILQDAWTCRIEVAATELA